MSAEVVEHLRPVIQCCAPTDSVAIFRHCSSVTKVQSLAITVIAGILSAASSSVNCWQGLIFIKMSHYPIAFAKSSVSSA